jgi:predicted nucleic acid-binding protein
VILDTDVLIDLVRKHPAATAWFQSLTRLPSVCGFAALELSFGCANRNDLIAVERFLSIFDVAWPSKGDLVRVLAEYPTLRLSGGLSAMDGLIATTAIGLGDTLATFNVKHFSAVPELITVQPYVR